MSADDPYADLTIPRVRGGWRLALRRPRRRGRIPPAIWIWFIMAVACSLWLFR